MAELHHVVNRLLLWADGKEASKMLKLWNPRQAIPKGCAVWGHKSLPLFKVSKRLNNLPTINYPVYSTSVRVFVAEPQNAINRLHLRQYRSSHIWQKTDFTVYNPTYHPENRRDVFQNDNILTRNL